MNEGLHSGIIAVAGTAFHQNEIRFVRPSDPISLVREPENKHDPNAIKVMFKNLHLGYIPADLAQHMAPLLDNPSGDSITVKIEEAHSYRDSRSGKVLWGLSIRLTIGGSNGS